MHTARNLAAVVNAILVVIVCVLQMGCGRGEPKSAEAAQARTVTLASAETQSSVELTASQLTAIKIEPVSSYAFAVYKEGVGSIDFDEDLPLVQAESTLLSAAASSELSGKVLARAKDLYGNNGGIPQKELEQANSDHQSAEAALKAARDAVRALGKTDVEIDRMIAARKIESANTSTEWLVANVAESDAPFVQKAQVVELTVPAYRDRVFTATVARVYAVVDPATHRSRIRCDISDPKHELRPGMLANFKIRVQDPIEARALPADAVVREGDGTMTAWVTADRHRFQQKIIKVGVTQNNHVQVVDGVDRGELVVTEGGVFLSNLLQAPPSD